MFRIGHDTSMGSIDEWAAWQAAAGRAAGTIYLQRRYLHRFADSHDLAAATSSQVAAWLGSHGWSNATIKSARMALASFYHWAVGAGLRADDPTVMLGAVRLPPPCPRPASDAVFVGACQRASGPELLMLLLAATCGLRRAEIAGLHTDDYAGGDLRVRGKGGRVRLVPVVNADLARLLEQHPPGWLFPGRFGGHVTPDHVGRHLSTLLGPGWSAHSLRHRYASVVYAGSHDLFAVQKLLGHASPETTQRYVHTDHAALVATARWAA